MVNGLICGKFYPFHKGHEFLIKTASEQCDILNVLVVIGDNEEPHAYTRAEWIKATFPRSNVHVGSIMDIHDDTNSEAWAIATKKVIDYCDIHKVFTSEDYGNEYAKYLGAEHICVDKNRVTYPCSGSLIRSNPLEQWGFLPDAVKAYYALRICIIGAESTGTTTLAKDLAKYYGTTWVGEYGRHYTESRGLKIPWKSSEFEHIATMQSLNEDAIARICNRVLICDTDAFATKLWHRRYMEGTDNPILNELIASRNIMGLKKSLYILTGDEIPFVPDSTRDGESIRKQMTIDFMNELNKENLPWMIVTGSPVQRMLDATRVISSLLG
jgi:NadR type nicotinamide-nucleotide adenylyltransferase